jgi:hypothetical protein
MTYPFQLAIHTNLCFFFNYYYLKRKSSTAQFARHFMMKKNPCSSKRRKKDISNVFEIMFFKNLIFLYF